MSQSTQQVIDLTEDGSSPVAAQIVPPTFTNLEGQRGAQRPPRFDRDIISIDDQEDDAAGSRDDSPEIQFLTSRPRSRSLSITRRLRPQSTLRQRRHTPAARSPPRRPQVSVRITGAPVEAHGHQNAAWFLHPFAARVNANPPQPHEDELVEWEHFGGGNIEVPAHLNYMSPAFDLREPARRQPPPPRMPTYDPPTPAQEGFTRTPNEDDVLVCPNCDDELGLGDDEVKRQVWVVKACGHVRAKYSSTLVKLIQISGLLWRVCKEQVPQQEVSALGYVKTSQTIFKVRCGTLWKERLAPEKHHSGVHVNQRLSCLRLCVCVFSTSQ